jgi:two-component system, chemotaxis family, chemotaxis protein CheY
MENKRVLCVDDSSASRRIVADVLKDLGVASVEAVDGVDGLNHLAGDHFDLVILDINMPNLDGAEMLEGMRMQSDNTPALVVTGEVKPNTVAFLKKMGIEDLLFKPFQAKDLKAKVCKALKLDTEAPGDSEAAGQAAAQAKPADMVVLSDKDLVQQKLRELIPPGHELDICRKGTDCMLACRKRPYRMIFFDSGLSETNLTALFEQLRALRPRAAFVGIALHDQEGIEAELQRMGCDAVITHASDLSLVRTLVDQGCAIFEHTTATQGNVIHIEPLLLPRKRFDEYYAHFKARISDLVRANAEACETLGIIDMSHLSELDATWVARMLGEAKQVGASMEVELWAVGSDQVLSQIPRCAAIRTFRTLDEALKAAQGR